MVAAEGARTLRLAARYADWWNADWLAPEAYRALAERLDAACAAEGRDPATLRKTLLTVVSCAPSEREARAALADSPIPSRNPLDNALVGTPGQVLAQLRPYLTAGADYIIVATPHFPDETTLTLLRDEVLPALRNGD
jgi:alkanesulfonate monooxygenase SsuD/methylene tetrahydromethanopterin reductase-like flavin-dependent oxidoreductase (luciferase family)